MEKPLLGIPNDDDDHLHRKYVVGTLHTVECKKHLVTKAHGSLPVGHAALRGETEYVPSTSCMPKV